MRQLTIKQKQLLRKWFKESEPNDFERTVLNKSNALQGVENLTVGQWEELQQINDT